MTVMLRLVGSGLPLAATAVAPSIGMATALFAASGAVYCSPGSLLLGRRQSWVLSRRPTDPRCDGEREERREQGGAEHGGKTDVRSGEQEQDARGRDAGRRPDHL